MTIGSTDGKPWTEALPQQERPEPKPGKQASLAAPERRRA